MVTNRSRAFFGVCNFGCTHFLLKGIFMKKKIFIIVIVIVLLIGGFTGVAVYNNTNHNTYIENINLFLSKNEFANLKPSFAFDEKSENIVNVTVNSSFSELDFKTQKEFIYNTTTELNNLFTQYQNKQLFKEKSENKIYILSDNNVYSCDIQSENNFNIVKNEKIYDEIEYLREKVALKISADTEYSKYIYSISNIDNLKNLLKITNAEQCKKEILYLIAKQHIENDSDDTATNILLNLGDYKDSKQLVARLKEKHEFDGTWYGSNGLLGEYRIAHKWIISGDRCYNIYTEDNTKNGINNYYCKRKGNDLYIFKYEKDQDDYANALFVFNYANGTFSYKYLYYTKLISLEKISDNTELPTTSYIRDPAIGMTAEEVRASTWGSPKKINKDTYSWGVREQWVYGDGRYIYFQDGVVTSISTSD